MKRVISLFLALTVFVSLLIPLPAFALDLGETSGSCGEALTWSYNSGSGALTIEGNGAMHNFSASGNVAPWKHLSKYIYSIDIKEGVTSVGNWAFGYCYHARMLNLPESLEKIGKSAFYQCTSLEEILIPDSVTFIDSGAFSYCKKLGSISIPKTVKALPIYMLYGCDKLSTVYFAASQSDWQSVSVHSSNTKYLDNAQIIFDTKAGVTWTFDPETGALRISGVGRIENYDPHTAPWSVYESKITSLTVDSGITGIGNYAFGYCYKLKQVSLPDTLTYIGSGVFYKCTALESINLPESINTIFSGTFYQCKKLNNVTIPSGIKTVQVHTFSGCDSLTDVYFNGTAAQWQHVSVLANNSALDNIKFTKQSVTWSFDEQSGTLTVSGNVPMDDYDANSEPMAPWNAHRDDIKTVIIENGVQSIGSYAFYGCKNLTAVAIADSVSTIGTNAFYGCSSLDNVIIPESVKTLGGGAFYKNTAMTNITFPGSITSVLSHTFSGCDNLKTVYYKGTQTQLDALSVSETGNAPFINAEFVLGDRIPTADVTELGAKEVPYNGESLVLDTAYSFKATETFDIVNAVSPFKYYHADFVVSFDNDVNDVILAGYYKLYADYVKSEDWVPLVFENVKAGEKIRVLNEKWFSGDGSVNYQELCQIGEFLCGVLDEDGDDENTTITVELRLYEVTENAPETSVETGEYITAGTYTYKFPEKVKIYSFDQETKTLNLFGNGEDVEVGKEPFAKYSADIRTVNITKDVTVIGANAFANASSIENVIYDGTRAEWNLIRIGDGNDNLLNANITFATYQGEMFDKKFTGDFLYRVGNSGAVKLGTLFSEKDGLETDSKTVALTWKSLDESANASVTYVQNTADWKESTLTFSGEGVIELSISDLSLETTLSLEVVTAKNVTTYSQLVNGNCVLLNDIKMSSNGTYAMSNASLYGNGFTFDVTDGAYTGTGYATGNYVILMQNNSVIDNTKIIGKVYTEYGATSSADYNRAAVLSYGTDNLIVNSYISNTGSPVRVHSGSISIVNTTLKGGSFANLDIRNGNVNLTDVTTINQVSENDLGDGGEKVVGFGIVSYYESVSEDTTVTVNGTLTQYNNFAKSHISYIANSTAQAFLTTVFGTEYANYIYTDASGEKWINTGILSMMETVGADDITDNRASHDYIGQKAVAYGKTGYIYAPRAKAPETSAYTFAGTNHFEIKKTPTFDYTGKNYEPKTDGSNRYCYYDEGRVNISIDSGDTFSWDPFIIKDTFKKGGAAIPYTVKMNGTSYAGAIPFNADGDYTVEYTYTDEFNYRLMADGTVEKYTKTYTATVNITVAVVLPNAKNATFDFSGNGYKEVKVGNDVYVMPNVSATSSTVASKTVSGTTVYCPIVNVVMSDGKTTHSSGWYAYFPVFSGVVTITDYADKGLGDPVTYDASTQSLPAGLTAVNPTSAFQYASATAASSTPSVKNNILVYSSAKIEANRSEMNIDVEYTYTDNAGAIYHYYVRYYAPAQKYSPGCVTPDTLVTLADGTQKQVQYLTGDETLLVWNHETGALDTAPIAYIVDHGRQETETTVITLLFENGKQIEIIGEHVFYNMDTDKYVTLDKNAKDFIGKTFAMQGADGIYGAKLTDVKAETTTSGAYEVVTYKNVTCFTNGILSASAYLDKLLNIFDIDANTKAYVNTAEDVEKYGLYTYADFEDIISEDAFELYNAKYLKIAVGKGYITWDDIMDLVDIYFTENVTPIK